jgi:putative transposase
MSQRLPSFFCRYTEARQSLSKYFSFYNARRLHENLDYATPDEVYFAELATVTAAAA